MIKQTIRQMRINAELTQQEVERRLKLKNGTVSKWEKHELKPQLEIIGKLSEIYGVSVCDIVRLYEGK